METLVPGRGGPTHEGSGELPSITVIPPVALQFQHGRHNHGQGTIQPLWLTTVEDTGFFTSSWMSLIHRSTLSDPSGLKEIWTKHQKPIRTTILTGRYSRWRDYDNIFCIH